MADLHLPTTLPPLFPGLPRPRPRGGAPRGEAELRPHIHVYVDRERAELDTPLGAASRVDVIAAISGG